MSVDDSRSIETLRRDLGSEREKLVQSLAELRGEMARVRHRPLEVGVPALLGAALLGFLLAGGVRATVRLVALRERRRRRREETGLARLLLR